jgi:ribonuclease R
MKLNNENIIKVVRAGGGRFGKRELVRELNLTGEGRRELRQLLAELVNGGQLVRTDRKTYRMADELPNVMVLRIDHIDDHGDMVGIPAKWEGSGEAPHVLVDEKPAHKKLGKHHASKLGVGSQALCRISQQGDVYKGELIKVLGRGPEKSLGVVIKGGRGFRIRPVAKGSRYDHVPERGANLVDQDLVMFELTSARHKGDRIARIVENLGSANHPRSASIISLFEHNVPIGFDDAELEFAKNLKLPKLDKYREDIRDLPLVTIDPDDAKDFDDAIFAERDTAEKNKDGWVIWVAIADVSAYVPSGSVLDKGAYKRGNSVYLPDRVEPMLPEELSADLCSLRPNEDRACLAVRMRFNAEGDKIGHKFVRGLMRSHARLTYGQAQTIFAGNKPEDQAKAAQAVSGTLTDIFAAYQTLLIARERRAPLEIEVPERRVKVDEKGNVASITVQDRFDAHKLVEEFMIQANVAAAEALDKKQAPMLFRVHEPPDAEKVQGLADFLPALDLKWTKGERVTTRRFNKLLEFAKTKDLVETVGMSVLRTQMKAVYTPKNGGHFGLNLTHYTHFTSPIRRYADLIVHRALISTLGLGEDGTTPEEISRLPEIAEHISDTERRAMAAERDAKDRYIAAYLQDRVGATFPGRIGGVTRSGLFIQLDETGADGFAPVSRLGLERFLFDEKLKSLVGADTGGTYKFGARVEVKLKEAMPLTGGLIFEVLTQPEKGKIPKHQPRHGSGYVKRGGKPKHKRKRR